MSTQVTSPILEVKRSSLTDTGEFFAYASTWGEPPDSDGDIILRGAFKYTLADHKIAGTNPAMLWSHRQDEPVGKWLSFSEDDHGLLGHGKLTLGTKRGREAFELLKDDALGFSIGFTIAPGGAEQKASHREISRIARLVEVSVVAVPANTRATLKPKTRKEFEHLLRKATGFSAREAKRAAAGGWGAYARNERDKLDLVLDEISELKTTIARLER